MKRFVDVHTGEVMAGNEEVVLKSETNMACLVIAAYDQAKRVGGLAHAMFFSGIEKSSTAMRDAAAAIDEMLEDMRLLGAEERNIEIRLVTGENVPHQEHDPDYDNRLSSAVDILKQRHVRLGENVVVDAGKSHVLLDVESGDISYV